MGFGGTGREFPRHVGKFGHEAAFGADESARDKICSWIKFDVVTLMEG